MKFFYSLIKEENEKLLCQKLFVIFKSQLWKMLRYKIPCSFLIIRVCMFQMDGFDQTVNVKVIMATNRADTLDPALLRPGRLDRKIEFPVPDRRQKRLVFQVSFVF